MLALMSPELSDLLKGQDLAKEHLNQAKGTELCPLMWRGCGQTGLLQEKAGWHGQGEGATHRRRSFRSLRGHLRVCACSVSLQTVMGFGQKWCRCPGKMTQVIEEGKEVLRDVPQIHLLMLRPAAPHTHGHSQELVLKGCEKSHHRKAKPQPLILSLEAAPLQLRPAILFSQISLVKNPGDKQRHNQADTKTLAQICLQETGIFIKLTDSFLFWFPFNICTAYV